MGEPRRPRKIVRVVAVLLGLGMLAGCGVRLSRALRGYAVTRSVEMVRLERALAASKLTSAEWGGLYALHGDFGTLTTDNLTTNAVPWKLLSVLSQVVPEPFRDGGRLGWKSVEGQPLRRFGMIYGVSISGPPGLKAHSRFTQLPVGYAHGVASRTLPSLTIELAATNCSMCHGGRSWDAQGNPTEKIWWGIPNHSLDFDGLVEAIVAAVSDPRATDAALLAAMKQTFPDVSEGELRTYKRYVLPAFRKAIVKAKARWGSLHPWRFGGPGFSHGAAILKEMMSPDPGQLGAVDFPAAFVKIPNLYGVLGKDRLLVDGSYVSRPEANRDERFVNHMIGFLPVLGASVERAVAAAPHLRLVRAFLASLEPPRFPGPIDENRAAQGKLLYTERCASCHGDRAADGSYSYPNKRIPIEAIGTDPKRAQSIAPALAAKFNKTGIGKHMRVEQTLSYLPPPLRGIWASAPYLHNGSVPTLWHLLSPTERPRKFWVGGHRLDLRRVGVLGEPDKDGVLTYPAGYVPWSEPRLTDTREPGRSNRGHVTPTEGLTEADRWKLIEYLKVL